MIYSKIDEDNTEHLGTYYWIKYIKGRIERNKNFMGVFIGQTGSGKSYAMLGLSDKLQSGGVNMDNVFLKASDFLKKIADTSEGKLNPGDVLGWDEAGVELNSKQWQSKANRVVNFVMQVFRKENLIVFFTLPFFSFLDADARKLVHATFETVGIDFKTKEVIIKPMVIQTNQDTGKMYKKYLRVRVPGKGIMPIKKIRIGLINPEKLKIYEESKDQFAKKLYEESLRIILASEDRVNSLPNDHKKVLEYLKEHPDASNHQIAENCKILYETGKDIGKANITKVIRLRSFLRNNAFLS